MSIDIAPHHRLIVQMQQRAATGGLVIRNGAPVVKFRHVTGSIILTRSVDLYRRSPGWTELPFDTSSPVPRKP